MKTCPGCSFLMGDDETMCAACSSPGHRSSTDHGAAHEAAVDSATPSSSPGSTLLLDRPVVVSPRQEVRFRDPVRGRRVARGVLVLAVVGVAFGVLGAMALRGDGPLASTAVSLGLADPPLVAVPKDWTTKTSAEGQFSVELPLGAIEQDRPDGDTGELDDTFVGYRVDLGEEGQMLIMSSDAGIGAERLRTLDSGTFDWLIDTFLAEGRFGIESVRRDVVLKEGVGKDSVIVDGSSHTARARFVLAGGRSHVLVTVGPDSESRELDRAHSRMIESFDPTS